MWNLICSKGSISYKKKKINNIINIMEKNNNVLKHSTETVNIRLFFQV